MLTWSSSCAWNGGKVCCGSHDCDFWCFRIFCIVRVVLAAEMWWREYGSGGRLIEMIARHDEINFELVEHDALSR